MKIVQINATCGAGSTGKICSAVAALFGLNQLKNPSLLNEYARNACEAGKKNHDPESIHKLLFQVINNALASDKEGMK